AQYVKARRRMCQKQLREGCVRSSSVCKGQEKDVSEAAQYVKARRRMCQKQLKPERDEEALLTNRKRTPKPRGRSYHRRPTAKTKHKRKLHQPGGRRMVNNTASNHSDRATK
ncbi:hypothetical protein L9F63_024542, partial [Diploptera punctata]